MPVSDKMTDAVNAVESDFSCYGASDPTEIAQAVINAAWTKFARDDESTHPETDLAPSGNYWAVRVEVYGDKKFFTKSFSQREKWDCVVAYADPADLMGANK